MKPAKQAVYTPENFPREGLSERDIQFLKLRFSGKYTSIEEIANAMGCSRQNVTNYVISRILKKLPCYTRDMLVFKPRKGKNKTQAETQLRLIPDDNGVESKSAVKYSKNQQRFLELRFSGKCHSMKEIADAMGKKSLTYVGQKLVQSIVNKGEYTRDQLLFYPKCGNGKSGKKRSTDTAAVQGNAPAQTTAVTQTAGTAACGVTSIAELYKAISPDGQVHEMLTENPFHDNDLTAIQRMIALCATILEVLPDESTGPYITQNNFEETFPECIEGETPEVKLQKVEKLLTAAMEMQQRSQNHFEDMRIIFDKLKEQIRNTMSSAIDVCFSFYVILSGQKAAEDAVLRYSEMRQELQNEIEEQNKIYCVTFDGSSGEHLLPAEPECSLKYLNFLFFAKQDSIQVILKESSAMEVKEAATYLAKLDEFAEKTNCNNLSIWFKEECTAGKILAAYFSLSAEERYRTDIQYHAEVEYMQR